MKKTLFFAMCVCSITTFAQSSDALKSRVGINTEKPRATLDIVGKPITNADKQFSRGVILPHISDAQKAEFTDKTEGLMIWNTTKKCIDFWNGTQWQCYGETTNTTPPATTTYTGTAIWGDDADERIRVKKASCPSPQIADNINYPVNTSQHITYTATSTVSQADANQKALDLMNSTAKQQERQTLAQNYANANGTCTPAPYEWYLYRNAAATAVSGATTGRVERSLGVQGAMQACRNQAVREGRNTPPHSCAVYDTYDNTLKTEVYF